MSSNEPEAVVHRQSSCTLRKLSVVHATTDACPTMQSSSTVLFITQLFLLLAARKCSSFFLDRMTLQI